MAEIDIVVPDTSVIIESLVSDQIKKGELKPKKIVIHEAVLAELEYQANENKAMGFLGLEELRRLRALSREKEFEMQFSGKRPSAQEIRHAKLGEIDSIIRDLAYDQGATLMTSDKVQAKAAEAKGVETLFIRMEQKKKTIRLESYFDPETMSVHLRELVFAFAKRGRPGNWEFKQVSEKVLTRDDIQEISTEIIDEAGLRNDGFIEIERPGSTIVQLGKYRIVITKPPFSDGWEITAVRPVKKLSLEEYKISEKLMQRIAEQAEGILIAGAPGMGKSTFAQALIEHYAKKDKIVKTIEAPRDLVLPENVTQYAISHGDAQEVHDVLLLSRPDYTLFDEMRNTDDFKLFADLRLAGIGLAGVVHATNPIDAIQRFVGRIELGVIPQVVDTVIFIKNGTVAKVLNLKMVIKVPSGMTEADLARPVVVVSDFENQKPEFELYTYGEQTVVVPVTETKKSGTHQIAQVALQREFDRIVPGAELEVVSDHKCIVRVPESEIPRLIGKQGKNIEKIEKQLGMSIDVQELESNKATGKQELQFDAEITKNAIKLHVGGKYSGRDVHIYIEDDYVLTAKVGKSGMIQLSKDNKVGKIMANAINFKERVRLLVD